MPQPVPPSARIAVLADCDNSSPEALAYALSLVPASARVVLRQGYGNDATTEKQRWREALNRQAFTFFHQFGTGKNASDIALAVDALELLLEGRADTFYLLTSDADFAALCRKLRARGATVFIVGKAETSPMLCEACDGFYLFPPAPVSRQATLAQPLAQAVAKPPAPAAEENLTKRQEQTLIAAVAALAPSNPDGWVAMQPLGHYLHTQLGFSAKAHGYSSVAKMIRKCSALHAEPENHPTRVRLKQATGTAASVTPIRSANQ